jgi:hypothetical protein
MGNGVGQAVWAGLVVVALFGCSSDEEDAASSGWDSCEIDADGCTCVIREGGSAQAFPPADDCGGYDCCLLSRSAADRSASCECFDTGDSCDDIAETSGKMVVGQCPPAGEALSTRAMCVPEGQACPNRASVERSGCCEGLLCLSDGEEPVCQPLGARDQDLARLCESATLSRSDDVEVIAGNVATSAGDLSFENAAFGTSNVGPSGCLNALTMQFRGPRTAGADGGPGACELTIDAQRRDGAWAVRRVVASLDACDGHTAAASGAIDVREAAAIDFDFSSVGEGCGARDSEGEHCVAGTFDWVLTGELGGITFESSRLIAQGVICGGPDDATCEIDTASDAGR